MSRWICGLVSFGLLLSLAPSAGADVITLPAAKDNTLYGSDSDTLSNGEGQHFFAGRTGQAADFLRRGLIQFDIAGNIPSGAAIDNVELTLNMSRTHFSAGPRTVELRRLMSDWGEAGSDAPLDEGRGTHALAGDATWVHTSFDTEFWQTPGGDFAASASASAVVDQVGSYTWGSTAAMVSDVQAWLDTPQLNFGWLLLGDESAARSAKRFDTHEHPTESVRPQLTVTFTPAGCNCPSQCDYDESGFLDALDMGTLIDVLFAGKPPVQDGGCPTFRGDFDNSSFPDALDLGALIDHLFAGAAGPCDPCDPVQSTCAK